MFKRQIFLVFMVTIIFAGIANATEHRSTAPDILIPRESADTFPSILQEPESTGPIQTANGDWYMPAGNELRAIEGKQSLQANGGPDDYGYKWRDLEPFDWIDASNGSDTGVWRDEPASGPFQIGFPFKYYENTYSRLYVSLYGFISFNDYYLYETQPFIPNPSVPNDVIAPHWSASNDVNGYVRYMRGGSAPNRWFVVEWNRIDGNYGNEFTFELILKENNDILFQYGDMNYGSNGWWCQSSGIEDTRGLDGLAITPFCTKIIDNHAVLVSRPPALARLRIDKPYQGTFASADQSLVYPLLLHNTGELGTDTYDLNATSQWPIKWIDTNGTELTDTDGDGILDSGPIPQGDSALITAHIQAPTIANVGDNNKANVIVSSSIEPTTALTSSLRAAVPAPFAQAYVNSVDNAMSLYLVKPDGQKVQKVTPDKQHGYNPTVVEIAGFAYVWSQYTYLGEGVGISDIEYTMLDEVGNNSRGVMKLTDHHAATIDSRDRNPVAAVAPNGNVGVAWYRYYYDDSIKRDNYNIWFAIVNNVGDVIYGPENITQNTQWGNSSSIGIPQFYQPRIAATGNNRWILAFRRYSWEGDYSKSDIYFAVRNSDGTDRRSPEKFTNSTDKHYYTSPSLTSLKDDLVLLAYAANGDVVYSVLDSEGNTIKGETYTGGKGNNPDAVQLSNDRILLAWSGSTEFVLLDGGSYNVMAGPTVLDNPAAVSGDYYVSVAKDNNGHGILTWMDAILGYRHHLYYALVDGNGQVITEPTIFREGELTSWGRHTVETSFEGNGSTSHTVEPASIGIDAFINGPDLIVAKPGSVATIPLDFGNLGKAQATGVRVTATLPDNFAYSGDSSDTTPVIDGNDLTWQFSKGLDFLGHGKFSLYVGVPDESVGKIYNLPIKIEADQSDANSGNNTQIVKILVTERVLLPIIAR